MEMKIPLVAISAFVVVVVLGAVLMPVLDDASETERTFTNEGFFYAKKLDANSTDVLSYDHTNPTKLTINDVEIDTSSMQSSYNNITVAFSEKWFIRFALDTAVIYLYEADSANSSSTDYASVSNQKDFVMTCENGTATIVCGETTYTESISGDGLIISSNEAEYVMKKSTTKAYVLGDSVVYGSGRTDRALGVSGSSFNAMFKASVDDGVTPIAYSPNTYTVTGSSVVYTDGSSDYLDLYELTAYKIDITDGTNMGSITYNQIFVPHTVTAELSQHLSNNEIALLAAIPALVIIALIIGVVAIFVRSKMD